MLDVADMGAQVRKRQMEWFHCPIPDRAGWMARFGLIFQASCDINSFVGLK